MKPRVSFAFIGCSGLVFTAAVATAAAPPSKSDLAVVETAAPTPSPSRPGVPWLAEPARDFAQGEPTLVLGEGDLNARGWVATTNEHLLVRVVVKDREHLARSGDLLWDGDFVRIAVDGRGDGAMGAGPDTPGPFGPDDASFGLALTPDGPLGVVFVSGASDLKGKLAAEEAHITRNEALEETTYVLRLPWRRLHVMPGAVPAFGLSVRVKDRDRDKPDVFLNYGDGANDMRAGRFEQMPYGLPPAPFVAATLLSDTSWGAEAPAALAVGVFRDGTATLRATGGGARTARNIGSEQGWRRHRVTLAPPAGASAARLAIEVKSRRGGNVQLAQDVVLPEALFEGLWQRLDSLAASAPHPLFLRHVRSVRALTTAERGRLDAYRHNPALVRETLLQIRSLNEGFAGDAASWPAYLDGRRNLMFAYVSKRDGSLQSYSLMLPRTYDPAREGKAQQRMPLFVELHGAGNPHPMVWLSSRLGSNAKALDLLGYETPKSYASMERSGYHVEPFGRGNSRYRDIGEIDVWEAIADVEQQFAIDDDRRYLFGFSMGGSGTWALGSRTPDRWAALAIYGASPNPLPNIGLARNLKNTPVWHWYGENDNFAAPGAKALREELSRWGVRVTGSFTPNLSHVYTAAKQKEGVEWLARHVRKRPDRFSFVADTNEHLGVWGITMERDVALAGAPSFDCTIKGNQVSITSQGTKALNVRLGSDGLGLEGNVKVLWNGKPVHEGPAATIRLGPPAATTH